MSDLEVQNEPKLNGSDRGTVDTSVGAPAGTAAMSFPDGGMKAWLTVLGAWLTLFCTLGTITSFGIFQDYYTRIYLSDKSTSDISWIGSIQSFFLFVGALPTGILFDLGYFRYIMIFGTLLYSFSLFMLSLAKEGKYYQVFLSQGIGAGLAMGLLFIAPLSLIAHYFQRRRSLAMGIAISGSSFAGVIVPIMLNKLFEHPGVGFAWGVRAFAFMELGMLLIANFLLHPRLPNRREREAAGIKTPKPDVKGISRDYVWLTVGASGFFIVWGLFFPIFYLQLFAFQHGVDANLSFYSVSILNAASFFGRTVPGIAADRWGVYNVVLICTFVTGSLVFSLFGATSRGGVVAFGLFYGFFSGGYISLGAPLIASISPFHEIGFRIGLAYFITSFAILTGTPISGALLGPEYKWHKAIIFSGISVLVGTFSLAVSRHIHSKRKGTFWI